jgi:hypothetical protein
VIHNGSLFCIMVCVADLYTSGGDIIREERMPKGEWWPEFFIRVIQ